MDRKAKNRLFLNLHIAPYVKLLVGLSLVSLIFAIAFHFTWWYAPALMLALFVVVVILHMGYVRVEGQTLMIRTLRSQMVLKTPLHYDSWWCYAGKTSEEKQDAGGYDSKINEIDVYLLLRGSGDNRIAFVERIAFETRFPNEAHYAQKTPSPEHRLYKVQRADKLLRYLSQNLPQDQIVKAIS